MSTTVNENAVEAVSNQQEQQFSSRVAPSEPMMQKGHQPGRLTSSKDAAPEFAAQTLPPGTAPRESTFQPQPTEDVQQSTSLATDSSTLEGDSTAAAADATLTGATSADVNAGLGKPIQGQSATERQHDGAHERVKQRHGLEGVGAGGGPGPRAGDGRTA